jgi:hypothetical protein
MVTSGSVAQVGAPGLGLLRHLSVRPAISLLDLLGPVHRQVVGAHGDVGLHARGPCDRRAPRRPAPMGWVRLVGLIGDLGDDDLALPAP